MVAAFLLSFLLYLDRTQKRRNRWLLVELVVVLRELEGRLVSNDLEDHDISLLELETAVLSGECLLKLEPWEFDFLGA